MCDSFWMTEWNKNADSGERQKMLDELFALARNGDLQPFVERHSFDKFDDALKRVQDGQVGRKVVLTF